MKKIIWLWVLLLSMLGAGCTPQTPEASPSPSPDLPVFPTPPPSITLPSASEPVETTLSPAPTRPPSVEGSSGGSQQTGITSTYANETFGLSFQYPSGWFGPDEYISEDTLRVEIGSDKVYPYGTGLDERVYEMMNSYYVVIQYTRSNQNPVWQDTYQTLAGLKDGESTSDARSQVTRVRQIDLGNFSGYEYLSTLSESAQTEAVYTRQVILMDDQSNVISVMGNPNNVDVREGAGWREAYLSVDVENQATFEAIVDSIQVQK